MLDGFGRRIEYLRISVTDRCNFRCVYCMPARGLDWIPRPDLLTDDEMVGIVGTLAERGLRRLRVSGGEPTLRPGLPRLVERLHALPGIEDVALSTNGVRLPEMAAALRRAGVSRVNISIDSLRPERIHAIARRRLAFDPLTTIEAALGAGFSPVKLNMVVVRGLNEDEVADVARLTLSLDVHARFIELMPVGDLGQTAMDRLVPSAEVLASVAAELGELSPDGGPAAGNGPARYFRAPGARGSIGVITPLTHSYCEACNRVRLTADGMLRTCLFGSQQVDLRTPLRAGEDLAPWIERAMREKPRAHELLQLRTGGLLALSQTGG